MAKQQTYLVELPDSSFLSVPESKLEAVSNMTQEELDRPLNRAEQLLIDKLKEKLLRSRK